MRGLAVWTLVLVVMSACGGKQRPDQFQLTHQQSVEVGGGPTAPILTADGLTPPALGGGLTTDFSSSLENQGAKKGDVNSVVLTQLRLEVTAPLRNGAPFQDLRFLDSVAMFIKAPGLPEVKVAESRPPTTGTQSADFAMNVFAVDLPVLGVELKDYVTQDSMEARLSVSVNGRPGFSCTVQITSVMDVKLNPLGAAQNHLF